MNSPIARARRRDQNPWVSPIILTLPQSATIGLIKDSMTMTEWGAPRVVVMSTCLILSSVLNNLSIADGGRPVTGRSTGSISSFISCPLKGS